MPNFRYTARHDQLLSISSELQIHVKRVMGPLIAIGTGTLAAIDTNWGDDPWVIGVQIQPVDGFL